MIVTEKEVKRIVSMHFKEKYEIDVKPEDMDWRGHEDGLGEMPCFVKCLDIGGVIDEEDNTDSD